MTTPDSSPQRSSGIVPPGSPSWVTEELIEKTLAVWQRFYATPLTVEDAVEMLMRVSNLMRVLHPDAALLKGT
jgi:hypothetical protein